MFTLAWPGQDEQERWLGRNIDVSVIRLPASTSKYRDQAGPNAIAACMVQRCSEPRWASTLS